jgi:hypothetical protein
MDPAIFLVASIGKLEGRIRAQQCSIRSLDDAKAFGDASDLQALCYFSSLRVEDRTFTVVFFVLE